MEIELKKTNDLVITTDMEQDISESIEGISNPRIEVIPSVTVALRR